MGLTGHFEAIVVRLDKTALRHWHLRLLQRLRAAFPVPVGVQWGKMAVPCPPAVSLLFDFERIIHRQAGLGHMANLTPEVFGAEAQKPGAGTLVLDLCGDCSTERGRVWKLVVNGASGDGALLSALLQGQPRLVELIENGQTIAQARPGAEHPGMMLAAMNDISARCISFILAVLHGRMAQTQLTPAQASPTRLADGQLALKGTKELAGLVVRFLVHLIYRTPHWKTGYRFTDTYDFALTGQHPVEGWSVIPDDGRHFYADPFPFVQNSAAHIFAEDFDHKAGYGTICAFELLPDGRTGPAKTVLDTGSHLSYPFIFSAEGHIWMVPESGTVGEVSLYRASNYPLKWEKIAVLISGAEISDATLFQHNGQWWMMGCPRDEGGSYSDTLIIWHADDFRGPWRAYSGPMLIDAAYSRPAGQVFSHAGKLIRPVQDCAAYYGQRVHMMEITRLDDRNFAQKRIATLEAGPHWSGKRLHTYNRAGTLETIDGQAFGKKLF